LAAAVGFLLSRRLLESYNDAGTTRAVVTTAMRTIALLLALMLGFSSTL
jgi:hypothetical protein